jgi:hypothetical protein
MYMKKVISVISLLFFGSIAASAQKSAVFAADGAAIHGYDAVAYFTEGKAIKGDSLLSFNWNGAAWHFINQSNMDAFIVSPEKFAPQYGGYCAYGMSGGHKAPTDPQAWKIVDHKLYFNYNKSVQQLWLKKQQELIQTADRNWPSVKDKE